MVFDLQIQRPRRRPRRLTALAAVAMISLGALGLTACGDGQQASQEEPSPMDQESGMQQGGSTTGQDPMADGQEQSDF